MMSGSGVTYLPRVVLASWRCPLNRPTMVPPLTVEFGRTQTPGGSRLPPVTASREVTEPSKREGRRCRRVVLRWSGAPSVVWRSREKEKGKSRDEDIPKPTTGGIGICQMVMTGIAVGCACVLGAVGARVALELGRPSVCGPHVVRPREAMGEANAGGGVEPSGAVLCLGWTLLKRDARRRDRLAAVSCAWLSRTELEGHLRKFQAWAV